MMKDTNRQSLIIGDEFAQKIHVSPLVNDNGDASTGVLAESDWYEGASVKGLERELRGNTVDECVCTCPHSRAKLARTIYFRDRDFIGKYSGDIKRC